MNLRAFEDDLDRWGGDLARWPANARDGAAALLAGSAAARTLHASVMEVERTLALPSADLAGFSDFAAIATRRPQERPSFLRRAPPMVQRAGWVAAVAAALVLGILTGDGGHGGRDDSPDQVLASALGSSMGTVDVD